MNQQNQIEREIFFRIFYPFFRQSFAYLNNKSADNPLNRFMTISFLGIGQFLTFLACIEKRKKISENNSKNIMSDQSKGAKY